MSFQPLFGQTRIKRSFVDKIKGDAPIGMVADPVGELVVCMKIPGYQGDYPHSTMGFRPDNVAAFAKLLNNGPQVGGDPLVVAMRTLCWDEDGGCSFRLSYTPRSQTIKLTAADVADYGGLLQVITDQIAAAAAKAEEQPED